MRALITGVTGQDGSYLADLLLAKGYEVIGLMRRASNFSTKRIDHIYQDPHVENYRFKLVYGDMCDASSLNRIIRIYEPDEIYNLAAQSHVGVSFECPEYTADTVFMGTLRLLEAIRDSGIEPKIYQAGSSEMFGLVEETPQDELTSFYPRSPYAAAKCAAHYLAVNYREAYGYHISNGILFNHESPRRGKTFVTRKITRAAAKISAGQQSELHLGNIDAQRDWGFAGDYVEAMWRMLQQPQGGDYVVATGESHTVKDFLDEAFGYLDMDWHKYVHFDKRQIRPADVPMLCGNAAKAKEVLNWEPKTTFKELVRMMIDADLDEILK